MNCSSFAPDSPKSTRTVTVKSLSEKRLNSYGSLVALTTAEIVRIGV